MTEPLVGIEIQNIPSQVTKEDLLYVFLQGLDSGNEVKYILYPLPGNTGKAFVYLKQTLDARFVESILDQNPLWSMKLDTRMQTYTICSAEVNGLVIASMPDVGGCIQTLQKSYGVAAVYSEESGRLVLKGSLQQLLCAEEKLNQVFEDQVALQKFGLMRVGKSDIRSEDCFERDASSARHGSSGSRGKEFDREEGFDVGDDATRTSQFVDRKRIPRSDTVRSTISSSAFDFGDRNFTSLRSMNDNDNLQPQLPRIGFQGTSRTSQPVAGSGPQSLPCLLEIQEKKDFYGKPRNPSQVPSDFDKEGNFPHFDVPTSRRQTGIGNERKDGDGEYEYLGDDDLGMSRDLKSGRDVSSKSSAFRSNSENTTLRFESAANRVNDGFHKTITSTISPTQLHHHAGLDDDDDDDDDADDDDDDDYRGNIPSSMENKLEFNSGVVPLPQYSSVYYNTSSFGDTSHRRGLNELFGTGMERRSYVFPSETAAGHDLERDIHEDSHGQESLFLESFVVQYIVAVETRRANNIAIHCSVVIRVNIEPGCDITEVVFVGRGFCRDGDLKKALQKFTELYEETFNDIIQQEVQCDRDRPQVIAVMKRIDLLYRRRVILITDRPGVITLVGEFKEVTKALDMLNESKPAASLSGNTSERLDDVETARTDRETAISGENEADEDLEEVRSVLRSEEQNKRTNQSGISPNSNKSGRSVSSSSDKPTKSDNAAAAEMKQTDFSSSPNAHHFHMTFKQDFHVFNYTADITKVRVHAIVNAANSLLKNYGGVAGAIEKAGGLSFEKDCEQLYLSHGPLKVSEVVHTAGRGDLRCAFVMHTVGPQWYSDIDESKCAADLQATFKNVIDYADTVLQSVSLAVPAVGTGVYGVPLDVCARAIYFAVREFVDNRRSDMPLKYLHIVSKDPGTTELIQAVFEGLQLTQEDDQLENLEARKPSIDLNQTENVSGRKKRAEMSNEDV